VAAVTGLGLRRFGDAYLLEWQAAPGAGPREFVVYRDGRRLPVSLRGGTFYVDVGVDGQHEYAVSAVDHEGREGPRSAPVSTTEASVGWSR
jgi:arylamine N-acetyltransferase